MINNKTLLFNGHNTCYIFGYLFSTFSIVWFLNKNTPIFKDRAVRKQ